MGKTTITAPEKPYKTSSLKVSCGRIKPGRGKGLFSALSTGIYKVKHFRHAAFFLFFLVSVICVYPLDSNFHVLYVNSYHPGYDWSDQIFSGMKTVFSAESGKNIDLHVEYLDGKRNFRELKSTLGEKIIDLWHDKYDGTSIDLILTSDQDAYDLMRRARPALFPGVPLIFSGVENPGELDPQTTGIMSGTDFNGNIDLILEILPDTENIWVITDISVTGRINRAAAEESARLYKDKVTLAFFDDGSGIYPENLLAEAGKIKKPDVVFFLDYYTTPSGMAVNVRDFLEGLTSVSHVPVFSHVELYLDYGITGGRMNSGSMQGMQMAELGIKALEKGSVDGIPMQRGISMPVFDYEKLKYFNVSLSGLPGESRIVNQPDELLGKNFWLLTVLTCFLFFETYLITRLVSLVRRHKELQKEAKSSAELFKAMLQMAPIPIGFYGRKGIINEVNRRFSSLFGYSMDDKASIEEWWNAAYPDPAYRAEVIESWERALEKLESEGQEVVPGEYNVTCSDGRVITVEITVSLHNDNYIVCFMDVTERKKAEVKLQESLARFETLFEMLPYSCVIQDLDGRMLLANRRFCDIFGKPLDEIKGKTNEELGRIFDHEAAAKIRDEILKNGFVYAVECPVVNNGVMRYLLYSSRLIDWYDGKAILSATVDITDKKRMEEELRNSENNLRITLNSIGDAVIATDVSGRITRMNPVAEKLTGWSFSEAVNRNLSEVFNIINDETRQPIDNPVGKVIASGRITSLASRTILVRKDGREFQIDDSGAPILADNGAIVGAVLVFRDVTSENAMQAKLAHSQKMDAIGQLAGGVAHDFNNILGGIMGAAELLQLAIPADGKNSRYLSMIIESAQRASGLTKKLLSFSRKQQVSFHHVDVHEVILDTIEILDKTIDKRIRIEKKLTAGKASVLGDEALLQSVFLNLGINASHAMPEGGKLVFSSVEADITASYCEKSKFQLVPGSYIDIEVRDTGTGIPEQNLSRIFEPFFTTKKQGAGTGLGLSAVYGTVCQHRGAVSVYSEPGRGSSFHILLPLNHDPDFSLLPEQGVPEKGEGLVLLADDEEIMRITGKEMLESGGYSVILAGNGIEAVSIYRNERERISLVILDMIMPEMNGRDCFYELVKINPDVKVIIASGFVRDGELQEITDHGLSGFIHKPFRLGELLRIVNDTLKNEKPLKPRYSD